METLIQDLRYAFRGLAKTPGFAVVALLTLALGIGANTAIFSVVDAVLLRALPYAQPDRLVVILHDGSNPVAPGNFLDWQRQNHVFERMGAAEAWSGNLTSADKPEEIPGMRLTADMLPLLGVQPILGRGFLPEEDNEGNDHEVVLSYGFWQQRFGSSRNAIGSTISFDGEQYTVIGVMPRSFRFAPFWDTNAQVWIPLPLGRRAASRDGNSLRVFARLKPGATLSQASAEMATITAGLEQQFPGTNRNVTVLPLKEKVVGDVRPALLVLLGAVGFVLLIACMNVAHMLLARAAARQREIAIRVALGASRGRMLRQFLTESSLLALAGGVLGLLLAYWSTRALVALSPEDLARFAKPDLNCTVLIFALGISVLTGVAFGLAPAMRSWVATLADALKEGGRGLSDGAHRSRLRALLVISQFGFAVVLLAGAGLMIRTFIALERIDPGFNPQHVVSMVVSLAGSPTSPGQRALFFETVLEQMRSLPGVDSAGAINHLPLAGDTWGESFVVEGRPLPRPGEFPHAVYRVVLPGYFHAMNIPLLAGRDVTQADNERAPAVVVVNQYLARQYWPGESAIGKRISFDGSGDGRISWMTVVGVIKNVVRSDWSAAPAPEVYLPYLQSADYLKSPSPHFAYMWTVIRTHGEVSAQIASIEDVIRRLDKSVTISEVESMQDVVSDANAQPRFYLVLLSGFAAIALALAAVGIYGVMSHSVSRRTHEMAVRIALGARQSDVLRQVIGESMTLASIGGAVGVAGAFALTPLMSRLLYGVRAGDPLTFVLAAGLLCAVALLASYLPARRATRVEPVVALRWE